MTEIYPDKEEAANGILWNPPAASGKCPVQVMSDTEMACFTHHASQDRHYHKVATEIYMVLEGSMNVEVEGEVYSLAAGDMIVVNPGAIHQIRPEGTEFICRVVTANCGGASDKYMADEGPSH